MASSSCRGDKQIYSLDEILTLLEDEDITVENDQIDIFIQPPTNANDDLTDEDSGEEDNTTVHNLPGNQLLAPAEITLDDESQPEAIAPDETHPEGNEESPEIDDEQPTTSHDKPISKKRKISKTPKSKTQKSKKKKVKYTWCNNDMPPPDTDIWPVQHGEKNELSPMDQFFALFDEEIILLLVDKTNRYAALRNKLRDVSVDEMKTFIGILLLSGYVQLPRRRMYWETSVDTHNELVAKSMSRDRFEFIMSTLHVCDNDTLDKYDKFAKVRPLYNELNKRFLENMPHEEFHSVDESMVPYFGRHSLKQYIRGKPIRYGYKIWVGATTTGYIVWKDPYQGKSQTIDPTYSDLGLGASVVLGYCDVLQKHGDFPYFVFFDNFFTGYPLLEELSKRNIRATGTMRENRTVDCPLEDTKLMKKKERGALDFKTEKKKEIIVARWNDNSIVTVASNTTGVEPKVAVKRYSQKEKKKVTILQPKLINQYNKKMGGVDRSDQNMSLYRIQIRGKKWYFPLICDCIDSVEQNAWQLHRSSGGKLDHLAFRRRITCNILESFGKNTSSRSTRPSKSNKVDSRYDRLDHMVIPQDKQTRCACCHTKCTTRCKKCDVGLHTKCFVTYHTKE